jgi:ryanodine receptor 2
LTKLLFVFDSCRFLMGGEQGRLKFPPPENHSPLSECLLPTQILAIDPCFYFGDLHKTVLAGPMLVEDDSAFVPTPVNTDAVSKGALISNGAEYKRNE